MGAVRDIVVAAFADAKASTKGWWRANCPFCPSRVHKADKKRSFGIRPAEGVYHCYRCGTSGKVGPLTLDDVQQAQAEKREVEPEPADIGPPEGYVPLGVEPGRSAAVFTMARQYLGRRKLTARLVRELQIGACLTGRYRGRVIVPVLAEDGAWLGWVGRCWTPNPWLPYIYPSGMRKGEVFFNEAALHVQTDDPVLVVEGVFDALAFWPNAVALLGKASDDQKAALEVAARPVAVVLDGDAHDEGFALAMLLRAMGQRAGAVRLPPRVDPDEVPKAAVLAAAKDAVLSAACRVVL